MPGNYTLRLTAGDHTSTQPLTVKMDPRVKTSTAGLAQQFTLTKQIYDDLQASLPAAEQVEAIRTQIAHVKASASDPNVAEHLDALERKALSIEGTASEHSGGSSRAAEPAPDTLRTLNGTLTALMEDLQQADVAPTTQLASAVADRHKAIAEVMRRWHSFQTRDLPALNTQLKQAGLREITVQAAGAAIGH
jgi:hypothetical protein